MHRVRVSADPSQHVVVACRGDAGARLRPRAHHTIASARLRAASARVGSLFEYLGLTGAEFALEILHLLLLARDICTVLSLWVGDVSANDASIS